MKSGSCTWQIKDPNLIQNILSAEYKDCFTSDSVLQINNLKWKIELTPNGYVDRDKGICAVWVSLKDMPSSWCSIFCQLRIECRQMQTNDFQVVTYNMTSDDSNIRAYSFSGHISSFKRLKALNPKHLSFVVSIGIIRITVNEGKTVLYQMPMNKYKTNSRIKWTIDKTLMSELKKFDDLTGIHSDIYDGIWYMHLYPNGHGSTEEGDVTIVLSLCALPPNVSQINVKCATYCHETETYKTSSHEFNDHGHYLFSFNHFIFNKFQEFSQYETFTISVDITVVDAIDMQGWGKTERLWNVNYAPTHARIEALAKRVSIVEESKADCMNCKDVMKEVSTLKEQINILSARILPPKQNANAEHEIVRKWLKNEVNLEQYFDTFIENGFEDLDVIKTLNMKVLNMIQIEKIGHQMKILQAVARLEKESNPNHNNNTGNDIEEPPLKKRRLNK
eukprot:474602_1